MKTYEFTVEGRGSFPLDMLRYDRCWPKRESEDVLAMDPRTREGFLSTRRVTLVGLSEPTTGRWSSFGWKVVS